MGCGSAPVEAVDSPDGADTATDSGAAGAGSRRRALGRGGVDGSLSRTQAKRCEEAKAQAQAQVNQAKEQAEEWAAKIAEELKGFGPAPGKTVARFGRNDIRHFALTRLLDLVSEEERIRINLQNKLGPQFAILAKDFGDLPERDKTGEISRAPRPDLGRLPPSGPCYI